MQSCTKISIGIIISLQSNQIHFLITEKWYPPERFIYSK